MPQFPVIRNEVGSRGIITSFTMSRTYIHCTPSPRRVFVLPERKSRRYPQNRHPPASTTSHPTLRFKKFFWPFCLAKGWASRVNPKAAPPPRGEKIKVATRTAHPSPLGRRVNATLCTPHGSPTLMSAQDDVTGAGDRLFNDLQTTQFFFLPRHRRIRVIHERER